MNCEGAPVEARVVVWARGRGSAKADVQIQEYNNNKLCGKAAESLSERTARGETSPSSEVLLARAEEVQLLSAVDYSFINYL